jgi:hypothetical protein
MAPMLLDTSALQNLRYVSEKLDGSFLTDEDAGMLVRRYGHVLGRELAAWGLCYQRSSAAAQRGSFPKRL